jgi:glycosyltransferase involved in cell wall biosynthesis
MSSPRDGISPAPPLPRITVVTPSFNQAKYLETTIRSVLDQGYPNLEYMVADGGSTDGSVEVIKRYADRLAWWVSEKDRGQSHAINKAFERATGHVYGYINSDDFLFPGALETVGRTYAAGAKWVLGWVQTIEADGGEWPQLPGTMAGASDWFVRNPVPQQASFWAAELWKKLGPFKEEFRYAFDYEFWLRMRFKAGVSPTVVHKCLGSYRLHESSKTVSEWDLFEPEFEKSRAIYLPMLTAKQRREVRRKRRLKEFERHRVLGWQAMKKADLPEARKQAWAALRQNKLGLEAWRLALCAVRGR